MPPPINEPNPMQVRCHCGNHKIEAAPPVQVTTCTCSICSRYGAIWGYYQPNDVTITMVGEAAYAWGEKELEFVRCEHCGCVTHYRTLPDNPKPLIAINFRMAPAADIADIPVREFDGANLL